MIGLFQKRTKWRPLLTYHNGGNDYIVQVRKFKDGKMQFSVKNITPFGTCSYYFAGVSMFDPTKVFAELIAEQI